MNDDTLSDTVPQRLINTTASILPFKPKAVTSEVKAPVDMALVAMLEGFVERAKVGEIVFAAVASVSSTGVAYSSWEPEQSTPTLITSALGAISYLSQRFNQAALDGDSFIDS